MAQKLIQPKDTVNYNLLKNLDNIIEQSTKDSIGDIQTPHHPNMAPSYQIGSSKDLRSIVIKTFEKKSPQKENKLEFTVNYGGVKYNYIGIKEHTDKRGFNFLNSIYLTK